MPDDHHAETERQIHQLHHRADRLEQLGYRTLATQCRQEMLALIAAEAQRLAALGDAHTRIAECLERLGSLWTSISPRDSFNWFLDHTDDPEVVRLRDGLKQQKTRILLLEAARS